MNFLEELAAEYYERQEYFVKKNIKTGILPSGGYKGEMDVIAFHPVKKELIHLEVTNDAGAWDDKTDNKGNLKKGVKTKIIEKFHLVQKNLD